MTEAIHYQKNDVKTAALFYGKLQTNRRKIVSSVFTANFALNQQL